MVPDSTENEQPVDLNIQKPYWELPTPLFRVELLLSSSGVSDPRLSQLSIEGLSLKVASGIFRAASAYILNTASQDQSTGDQSENSLRQTRTPEKRPIYRKGTGLLGDDKRPQYPEGADDE